LTSFANDVRDARETAKTSGDPEAYLHVKRTTSQALRLLWPKGAASPFWRPDWSISVRAEASVRHWIRAWEATRMGANLVRLGSVDEAAFLAPLGSGATWVPRPYELGDGFGKVKRKDAVPVAEWTERRRAKR
jgi:hypothetical protein